MGGEKVCRTCLKQSSSERFVEINSSGYRGDTTIREKLKSCVPEMNIPDQQENIIMCSQCVALLESAFVFRTTCLDTEKKLMKVSIAYYSDLVKLLRQRGEPMDISSPESSTGTSTSTYTGRRTTSNSTPKPSTTRSTSAADSTTLSQTWSITTRRATYRASEPTMPVLEVEDENLREELKQSKPKPTVHSSKKPRMTEGQLLLDAIKNIPELRSHKPEMLNCRVAVQKLPASLANALTPPSSSSSKAKKGNKKDTAEQARAKKYCFTCRKWFDRPHRLQMHLKIVHATPEKPFECGHCGIGYYSKSGLRKHIVNRCPKTLKSKKTSLSPAVKNSKKSLASPKTPKSAANVTKPAAAATVSAPSSAVKSQPVVNNSSATINNNQAAEERDLPPPNITVKSEPQEENATPREPRDNTDQQMDRPPLLVPVKSEPLDPLSCDNNDLLQNSSEEPIFHCSICGEMFSTEKDLDGHKQSHAKCRICMESFQTEDMKSEHEKLHYNTKPGFYYCLVCKVTVKSRDHFNIHAGLRPYACDTCNKTFNCRSSLRSHRFLHSDVQPHMCTICKKGFAKPSYMLKHRVGCLKRNSNGLNTTNDDQVPVDIQTNHCNVCKKDFDSSIKMRSHICVNAEGERVFKCHICEKVLVGRKDFISHVKQHFVENESRIEVEMIDQ